MTQQCREDAGIAREAAAGIPLRARERGEIRRRRVGERIAFHVTPHEIDRAEFGRLRWQDLDSHSKVGGEPALDDLAAVRIAAIADDRDRRAERLQQVTERGAHTAGVDTRVQREPKETPRTVPTRRNHERCHPL